MSFRLPRISSRVRAPLALGLVAGLAAACGTSHTKNEGAKNLENAPELAGEWRTDCHKLDWLGFSYERQTLKFSLLGDFDRLTTVYTDASCATSSSSLSEHGTFSALGASQSTPNATDINFQIAAATVKPDSDDGAKALNALGYCGVTGWQSGGEVDVIGKTCLGRTHAKGEVIFDVYNIDQDGKRLKTGKASLLVDKSDANARPTKLDDSLPYAKQ